MKVDELMIGNIIEYSEEKVDYFGEHYTCNQQVKIDKNLLKTLLTDYDDEIAEVVKPIKLTAEILEKNGWILRDYCEYVSPFYISSKTCLKLFGFGEYYDERGFCVNIGFEQLRKNLKYVHELQNLLRSLGLNELANNFKI